MEPLQSHTSRWFGALFHQFSVSVNNWRRLSEAKTVECGQLRQMIQSLESKIKEISASEEQLKCVIEGQRDLIKSLEADLHVQTSLATVYNAVDNATPPPRPRTPWPSGILLSSDSSELSSIATLSPPKHEQSKLKRKASSSSHGGQKRQKIDED